MKKALSAFLALVTLLSFASCSEEIPATDDTDDTTVATTEVPENSSPESVTDQLNAMTGQLDSLEAIELAKQQGRGAIALHGKMIDAPIVARAQQTIAAAQALGIRREEA